MREKQHVRCENREVCSVSCEISIKFFKFNKFYNCPNNFSFIRFSPSQFSTVTVKSDFNLIFLIISFHFYVEKIIGGKTSELQFLFNYHLASIRDVLFILAVFWGHCF